MIEGMKLILVGVNHLSVVSWFIESKSIKDNLTLVVVARSKPRWLEYQTLGNIFNGSTWEYGVY